MPIASGQEASDKSRSFSPLTKKVFSFSKLDFVTSEGEFNEAICTLSIPDLNSDSPPFIAIYYRRENSLWFTESLYRKRLRFSFKDGVIKLDRSKADLHAEHESFVTNMKWVMNSNNSEIKRESIFSLLTSFIKSALFSGKLLPENFSSKK